MKKVIYLLLIIILFYIELCCSHCLYENQHSNHKVLKIDDEESLKKENITIENSNKKFDENIQKLTNKVIRHIFIEKEVWKVKFFCYDNNK